MDSLQQNSYDDAMAQKIVGHVRQIAKIPGNRYD